MACDSDILCIMWYTVDVNRYCFRIYCCRFVVVSFSFVFFMLYLVWQLVSISCWIIDERKTLEPKKSRQYWSLLNYIKINKMHCTIMYIVVCTVDASTYYYSVFFGFFLLCVHNKYRYNKRWIRHKREIQHTLGMPNILLLNRKK